MYCILEYGKQRWPMAPKSSRMRTEEGPPTRHERMKWSRPWDHGECKLLPKQLETYWGGLRAAVDVVSRKTSIAEQNHNEFQVFKPVFKSQYVGSPGPDLPGRDVL